MEMADKALYLAKNSGRNQVRVDQRFSLCASNAQVEVRH